MIKKFKIKKLIFIPVCLLLMIIVGIFLCGCQKQETESAKSTESTEEIKLETGQFFVYGQIASINGNEMTYYVMEEESDSDKTEESEKTMEKAEDSEKGERPQMPEGGFNGEPPEGFDGERPQMPEGGFNGEPPEGFDGERPQMPEGDFEGELPEGFEGARPQMPWGDRGTEGVNEEKTVTIQIPVGTKVTTRLGTETTFSRLAAGDNIKMLVQENDGQQEILEIWIVD